ncbi:MAG: hypothetical protein LBD16_02385 [Oscillospiraceae bacterium]|jgi:hypothetical protein|nr:hypothetical protein [Oscillospiraceae bacterium]
MKNTLRLRTIAIAIIMLIIMGVSVTPQSAFASTTQTDNTGIYDGRLVLLDEPATDAAPLLSYFPGAPIEVLSYKSANGNDRFWAQVRIGLGLGSIEGWVYNSALQWYKNCVSSIPTAHVDSATLTLTTDLAPGVIIRTYAEGTEVKILGRGMANNMMWEHVLVNGAIGFMNGAYLKHDSDSMYEKNVDGLAVGDKALVNSVSGKQAVIRDSTNDNGNIIGKLYNGTEVRVYETFFPRDGWAYIIVGELSSGFAVGFMRIEDLAFGEDKTDVISCIPTQSAASVLGLHTDSKLDLTGIPSDAFNTIMSSAILCWIDVGDNYEILGEWNAELANPSWSDMRNAEEMMVRYTAPNGDILTGYVAL